MPRMLKDKTTGERFVQEDDGTVRPITDEDAVNFVSSIDMDQSGIRAGFAGIKDRFIAKNFASNPAQAKSYLRGKGYWTADLDNVGGFNFAVQQRRYDPDGNPMPPDPAGWAVLDPKGFSNPKEFLMDMLDLTTDALEGIGVGSAAAAAAAASSFSGPGALAVGAAAGGAAGTGLAFARQAIGEMLGIEDNIDPTQALTVGAASAVAPVVGAGIGKLGKAALRGFVKTIRGAGEIPSVLAARLAKIPDLEGQDAVETLYRVARRGPGFIAETPLERLGLIRGKLNQISKSGWTEKLKVNEILDANSTTPIDILPAVKSLIGGRADTIAKIQGSNLANGFLDDLSSLLGRDLRAAAAKGNPILVTPRGANVFKLSLQEAAAGKGAFSGKVLANNQSLPSSYVSALANASKKARVALEVPMNKVSGRISFTDPARRTHNLTFGELNERMSKMTIAKNEMSRMFGSGQKSAEANLTGLFGTNKTEARAVVQQFDDLFGMNFHPGGATVEAAREIVASNSLRGPGAVFGEVPLLGEFTATGGLLGPALGASIGGILGGKEGAGIGAIGGFALGSPRAIIGLTRLAIKGKAAGRFATAPVRAVSRKLGTLASGIAGPEQRALAVAALQQMSKRIIVDDRPVLRQDAGKSAKRKELEGG